MKFGQGKVALRKAAIRYGMETLCATRAAALMRPFAQGVGAIAMLHRVVPASAHEFRPNQSLEITPEFLELIVKRLQHCDIDLISLDTMQHRLATGDRRRRFVCLTFDDGYRDNMRWAYPILKAHNVPFAIYVATSFPNRLGELYWVALESIVANNTEIVFDLAGATHSLHARTVREKETAFRTIVRRLHSCASEDEARETVRALAGRYGIDMAALCNELCLSWHEIARLAADPLVTIGAHTVNHPLLPRSSDAVVRSEFADARAALESALGRDVRHLAYPFGAAGAREFALAAEAGYATAVTTRPGVLFRKDSEAPMSLPRITIDGEFQRERYIDVLASGAGTAVWSGLKRLARPRSPMGYLLRAKTSS